MNVSNSKLYIKTANICVIVSVTFTISLSKTVYLVVHSTILLHTSHEPIKLTAANFKNKKNRKQQTLQEFPVYQ